MKKTSFKSIIHGILALFLVNLSVSCSSDDTKDAVVIDNVTVNKNNAFIDETIVLNIEGTGYTDANVYLLALIHPIKITKKAPTTFELKSAVTAPRVNVFAQLSNSTNKTEKSLVISFFIHGVDNFVYAEGIKPNDKVSKVIDLLGEPTNKMTSIVDPSIQSWDYPSKGISVVIFTNAAGASLVNSVSLKSSNFYTTMPDGSQVFFTNYPFELSRNLAGGVTTPWKINNATTKMDAIISKLGTPTVKAIDPNNPLLITYTFGNNAKFSFYGATVDDFKGKLVEACSL